LRCAISATEGVRPARERVIAREQEHPRVGVQLRRVERPRRHRQLDEPQVELAALDELVELEIGRRLGGPHLDPRPRRSEAVHQAGKDPDAHRLRDADAEHAGGPLGERREVGLRGVDAGDDRLGVAQHELAGGREPDRARSPRALDQPVADDPLERGYLLAHRRGHVAEPRRGASERPLARDGVERDEMAELDSVPGLHVRSLASAGVLHGARDRRCRGCTRPPPEGPRRPCASIAIPPTRRAASPF
jgi:hypothetical protein